MTARQRRNRAGRGFTLLEIITAVGLLVVVLAAVGTIFAAVGRTVEAGERVSQLNRYAAQLEGVMRADFEQMTRDGVLVIRNQYVRQPGGDAAVPVALSADSVAGARPRRVDEIMFFARGDFESSRLPLSPGYNAQSNEARIYYGHGVRRPDSNQAEHAAAGGLAETTNVPEPWLGGDDPVPQLGFGVNAEAASWVLLRQASLLSQPERGRQNLPVELFGYATVDPIFNDTRFQQSLQPAQASAFRDLTFGFFDPDLSAPSYLREFDSLGSRPTVLTGVVDVITGDLDEIRAVIQQASVFPSFDPRTPNVNTAYSGNAVAFLSDLPLLRVSGVEVQQAWIENLMPTNAASPQWGDPGGAATTRIRYAQTPPRLVPTPGNEDNELPLTADLSVVTASPPVFPSAGYTERPEEPLLLRRAMSLADQQMLGSQVFVPRCTEFIVEWSLGFRDQATGDLQWYGLERWDDRDGNGVQNGTEPWAAEPYVYPGWGQGNPDLPSFAPREDLVLGKNNLGGENTLATWVFGFVDPDGDNDGAVESLRRNNDNPGDLFDLDFDGNPTDESEQIRWGWPKLIRVTMSLADPSDPDIETTVQFVFEVPERE